MRLLNEDDVIRAVDKHTTDDDKLDDDITCVLEEVPTAFDINKVIKNIEICSDVMCTGCHKNKCKSCKHTLFKDLIISIILKGCELT